MKTIEQICKEINKDRYDLIQGCYSKKIFTDNLYNYIYKKYRQRVYLTEEDEMTRKEIITTEELAYQKWREETGKDNRGYKEVAAMFQINRYFENVFYNFIRLEYNLELYQNPRAYNNKKFKGMEPDLLDYEGNCYDIQGRVLFDHNTINCIQIPEKKINKNYPAFLDKYNTYNIIYYVLKGEEEVLVQLLNINNCYENFLFYRESEEQLKNSEQKYFRVNTEINFDLFNLKTMKRTKQIKKQRKEVRTMIDERTRLHRLEYKEKVKYCKSVDIRLILNYFNVLVNHDQQFICPFHNDTKPSAQVYESTNSIYCFSENKRYDIITTAQRLGNLTFVEALDLIIDVSLNQNRNNSVFKQTYTQIKRKTVEELNKEYEIAAKYCKTLEEILEDFEEKKKKNPHYKNILYFNALQYLEMRCIDYEKCKSILDLNNYRIGFNYIENENSFYCDYGYKDGEGYLIQRHINEFVRPGAYSAKKKFNRGNVRPAIIYTTNEKRDRNFYKNKTVVVVEGIMDALSLISMSENIEDYVIVVLNSANNLKKLFKTVNNEFQFIDELDMYSKFKLCLDSDKAGQKAVEEFIEMSRFDDVEICNLKIGNKTFNDLNDWWVYYKTEYLKEVM